MEKKHEKEEEENVKRRKEKGKESSWLDLCCRAAV